MTTSTQFYSTKRHSNVNIPNSKVCGARIKNPIMKTGYSDSVKTGSDNGVVKQRLSRFATEAERKEATSNCAGNVNWLNHRVGDGFKPPESSKNQFSIRRPRFNAGKDYEGPEAQNINDINRRGGIGNKTIIRPNFISPPIKSRLPVSFEKLQAVSISEAGESSSITDSKLGFMTTVKIPDETDFEWIKEKARLLPILIARFTASGNTAQESKALAERELEINKPLGRPQRTITKTTENIANDDKLSTKNKLIKIIQNVRAGRAENRKDQRVLTAQLVNILQDTQAISNLANAQLRGLGEAIARIGVPTNHKALGIIPRYVDGTFYNANAGLINLLLFSKVRETPNTNDFNYDKMVKNFAQHPNGIPAMKLTSAVSGLGRPDAQRLYLDLERGGVISRTELRASAGGIAGISGSADYNIQVANQ